LRNPAGWNHVFGLRPSQGRVPMSPAQDVFIAQLATEGPMARHVADLALLLSTQAGAHPSSPLSLTGDPSVFAGALDMDPKGQRVGWLGNLQGYLPMEEGVLDVCESALKSFSGMGCAVDEAVLGMPPEQVWQTWLVWRQALVASRIAPFLVNPANRAHLKAMKLGALVAVGINMHAPNVTASVAEWACSIIRREITDMMQRFAVGDVGTGEAKQENEVRRLFQHFQTMGAEQRRTHRCPEALMNSQVCPHAFLTVYVRRLACFKNDRRGPTRALQDLLSDMVKREVLEMVPLQQLTGEFNMKSPIYYPGPAW
jgi:hypothetical protein